MRHFLASLKTNGYLALDEEMVQYADEHSPVYHIAQYVWNLCAHYECNLQIFKHGIFRYTQNDEICFS